LTFETQVVIIVEYPRRDKMASTNEERKRYVKEYIRSLASIEECIEPYKEQKRELRSEFRENGWLNTDEIRAAVKAYRLYKGKVNIDEVVENFNMLAGLIGDEE
jgi:superfamily I DNA and/or RNA helicase